MQARLDAAAHFGRAVTQLEVGEHLGVTGVSVSRWEADKKEPDLKTIRALADLLMTDPGWLAFGKEQNRVLRLKTEPTPDPELWNALLAQRAAADAITNAYWRTAQVKTPEQARDSAFAFIKTNADFVRAMYNLAGARATGERTANALQTTLSARLLTAESLEELEGFLDEMIDLAHDLIRVSTETPITGIEMSEEELDAFLARHFDPYLVGEAHGGEIATERDFPEHSVRPEWQIEARLHELRRRKHWSLAAIISRAADLAGQYYYAATQDIADDVIHNAHQNREIFQWRDRLEEAIGRLETVEEVVDYVLDACHAFREDVWRTNDRTHPDRVKKILDVRKAQLAKRTRARNAIDRKTAAKKTPARGRKK